MPLTTRRGAALGVALAVAVLVGGCAQAVQGSANPVSTAEPGGAAGTPVPAPQVRAVAWIDDVCGAVLRFTHAVTVPPDLAGPDPGSVTQNLGGFLSSASTAAQGSLDALARVGPSPVEGGDAVVQRLSGTLGAVKTSLDGVRARLAALDLNDPAGLSTALPDALAPLQQLSEVSDPELVLRSNPELERAAEQAPNCRQVRTAGGR